MKKKEQWLTALVLTGLLSTTASIQAEAADSAANHDHSSSSTIAESVDVSGNYSEGTLSYLNAIRAYGNNADCTVNYTGETIKANRVIHLASDRAFGANFTWVGASANAYNGYGNGATLILGGDSTNLVDISLDVDAAYKVTDSKTGTVSTGKTGAIGIWAYNQYQNPNTKSGGQVIINGDKLNVDVKTTSNWAYGIIAQNCTTAATLQEGTTPATVTINAKDTEVNVSAADSGGAGLVAMSSGRIYANEGNIKITADDAIVARGNALIEINKNAKNTVKLDGDIDFNYDKPTSGTGVDADVDITLSDADSYFNGKIYKSGNPSTPTDDKGVVTGMTLKILNGAQWNMTGDSFVNNLTLASNGAINSKNSGQTLSVDNFTMSGGSVNFDGSTLGITKEGSVTDGTITGKVSVADTATLDLAGTTLANGELDGTIKVEDGTSSISDATGKVGKVNVGSNAELEISSSKGLTITDLTNAGKLTVDNVTANSFTAEAGSRLVVDGNKISGTNTPAISGVTSASVDDSAQLYIENAKKGEKYNITDKAISSASETYKAENILTSNSMLKFSNASQDGYDLVGTLKTVEEAYGDAVIIPNAMYEALDQDDTSAAADFFNTAADAKTHATKAKQAAAINSAAQMGALAGLTHGTYRAASLMTDAFTDHLSRDRHPEQANDLWAVYTHSKETIGGMSLAGGLEADYDLQLNGVVVGSDLYQKGTTTLGVALSYADGSASGWNGVAATKNDADYYGLSLYGRKDCGSMTYLGDITYLHGDNELTQYNSGKRLKDDADTDAFSIGVTAQREYQVGPGRLIPYAGLRYLMLGSGDYTDSLGLKHDADNQNLFVLPVGVKYAADIADPCGWTWRPSFEAGYVWNLGDRDTSETVSYHGAGNSFGYDTLDSGSLILKLGIQAEKDNMTYGLGYEYQNGDTTEANIFTADVKIRF